MNLDDLSQFDSQLQLSLAAWGYYYEDYIKLSTGIKILQTSRGTRDQDYEIRLVQSLAERRLNDKWSIGETLIIFCLRRVLASGCLPQLHSIKRHLDIRHKNKMDCTVAKCCKVFFSKVQRSFECNSTVL